MRHPQTDEIMNEFRDRGLTNDEIAELLEIPLESIAVINLEESA